MPVLGVVLRKAFICIDLETNKLPFLEPSCFVTDEATFMQRTHTSTLSLSLQLLVDQVLSLAPVPMFQGHLCCWSNCQRETVLSAQICSDVSLAQGRSAARQVHHPAWQPPHISTMKQGATPSSLRVVPASMEEMPTTSCDFKMKQPLINISQTF